MVDELIELRQAAEAVKIKITTKFDSFHQLLPTNQDKVIKKALKDMGEKIAEKINFKAVRRIVSEEIEKFYKNADDQHARNSKAALDAIGALQKQVDAFIDQYKSDVVAELPKFNDSRLANEDVSAVEDDEKFRKLRVSAKSTRNMLERMTMQTAIIDLVSAAITRRRDRIKILKERIDSGSAGSETEVETAKLKVKAFGKVIEVLQKRLSACLWDFAVTRHSVLTQICTSTEKVIELFPNGSEMLSSMFSGIRSNSANAIRVIGEQEDKIKRGPKKMASTGHSLRSK